MTKSKFNGAARANGKASSRPNGHSRRPNDTPLPRSSDDPSFSDPLSRSSDSPLSREEAVRQAVETVIQAAPDIARAVTAQAKQGNYLPAKFLFDFIGITGAPAAPAEDQSLASLLLTRLGLLPMEAAAHTGDVARLETQNVETSKAESASPSPPRI